MKKWRKGIVQLVAGMFAAIVLVAAVGVGWIEAVRPPRSDETRTLTQGVIYRRLYRTEPRRHAIHVVEIDRSRASTEIVVTRGVAAGSPDFRARTTSSFARTNAVHVAINASFFDPSFVYSPWDYYPRSGDVVQVLGRVVVDEATYGDVHSRAGTLCVSRSGQIRIQRAACPPGTRHAAPGGEILVDDGVISSDLNSPYATQPHPRTAVALNEARDRFWLVVADGRQPFYSDGLTLIEFAAFFEELGAFSALNLDGGGSSTLVVRTSDRNYEALNSPVHTRIPGRERPVGVHLGLRFPRN